MRIALFFLGLFFLNLKIYGQLEIERDYYPHGQLKSERSWRGGKPTSIWKTYYLNGAIQTEWDSLKDTFKEYYENGNIRTVILKDKTRKIKIIKHYFDDGKIISFGVFRDEKPLTGIEKHYDEEGNFVLRYKYRKGKIVGIEKIPPVSKETNEK